MFFYLTNISLDITLGITWWTIRQTSLAIYYLISKITKKDKINIEKSTKISYGGNDTDYVNNLEKLYNQQQEQIVTLNKNIENLTSILEKHNKL